jgi:hypothetical protein
VGVPVGSQAGAHGGQATTSMIGTAQGWPVGHPSEKQVGVPSKGTEQGWPLGFTDGTQAGPSITRGTAATVPQSHGDTDGREQARKSKKKSPPPDKFGRPNPPPKPNFGGLPSPHRQCRAPTKGKPTSLMQPQPLANVHPFMPTLKEWKHGIEVDCGPDWTWDVIEAAVVQGLHPTACTHEAITLFEEDIEYQRRAGFCKVIPWEELKRLRPPNLKISPMAEVPQVGRCPRIILDLSFPVYQDAMESSQPRRPVLTTLRPFEPPRKQSAR